MLTRFKKIGMIGSVMPTLSVPVSQLPEVAREMRKEVLAAIVRCNETKTFGVVEPLNSTVTHVCYS